MTKSVAFFCDSDSQIFVSLSFARCFLEKSWSVTFYLDRETQYPQSGLGSVVKEYNVQKLHYSELLNVIEERNISVVGFFSRASIINCFRRDVEAKWGKSKGNRPGIFTGFNGLSFEKSEEGFAWRLGYDVIALNGPRDKMLFDSFVANSPYASQKAIVSGLRPGGDVGRGDNIHKESSVSRIRNLIFAEQVDVPGDMLSRQYIATQLVRIAKLNPDWNVYIKCRVKKGETTFHYLNHSFEDLLAETKSIPKNISISYSPLSELLESCDLLLSVSSTAIFDALNRQVPTLTIADFGIRNKIGSHVFSNSNLSILLSDIKKIGNSCFREVDAGWLRWVGAGDANPNDLIEYFEKTDFNGDKFSPVYYSESQVRLLEELQTMTVLESLKNGFRVTLSFIRRKTGF